MNAYGFTIVSFFTPEYADCLAPFRAACTALRLASAVEQMVSRGQWAANAGLKPLALQRLRARLPGLLLYFDIDAHLQGTPAIPPGDWDIATSDNPVKAHKNRLAAQGLFIADNSLARAFLANWRSQVRQRGGQDHPSLLPAILSTPGLRSADATRALAGSWRHNGLRPERTQVK